MFIMEYISNHIVNKIPIHKLRYFFYKVILRIKLSSKSYIMLGQYIYSDIKKPLIIGHYTVINRNCILDRRGGLYIGNNVNISAEVAIYTGGHKIDSEDFAYYSKSVKIEDYVWIGTRAMIMPGAIVTKNVEDYSIVAGIPAKEIGKRNRNLTYNLTWRTMFL